jgi:hypothetical protein
VFFVYLFVNALGVVIYVGKTSNGFDVYKRLYEHKTSKEETDMYNEMAEVRFTKLHDESSMNNLEGLLQNLYQPKYNKKFEKYDENYAPGRLKWGKICKDNIVYKNVKGNCIIKIRKNIGSFDADGEEKLYAIQYEDGVFIEQDLGIQKYQFGPKCKTSRRYTKENLSIYEKNKKVKYYPYLGCDSDELFLKSRILINNSDFTYKFKVFDSSRDRCLKKLKEYAESYLLNEQRKIEDVKKKVEPRIAVYNSIIKDLENNKYG